MRLKEIKTIDVFTRWWHDEEFGNPYYARKIVVGMVDGTQKIFTVSETWGDVNGIENDHLERILGLPKSVTFTSKAMMRYIGYRCRNIKTIRYIYHKAIRTYREKSLENPIRFRNM